MLSAKAESLRRMQHSATGMVAAAFALRIGAEFLPDSTAVGYLRAFAEAAVVGGLADWFAVTALFRHPLGLPIPHTRILPRSKDRVAVSLSDFVVTNFLTPEVVERELVKIDLSARGAEFLAVKAPAIAARVTAMLPRLFRALDDEDISRFLENQLTDRLRTLSVAPLAGRLVELMTADHKHEEVVNDLLRIGEEGLNENRDVLTALIRREIPIPDTLSVPGVAIGLPLGTIKDKLAATIADEAIKRLLRTFAEVQEKPDHPLRERLQMRLVKLVDDLKESPEMARRGEEIKSDFLSNPNVADYASKVWAQIKDALLKDAALPDGQIRRQLTEGLVRLAGQIQNDAPLREKFNEGLRTAIGDIVSNNGAQFARMIEDTVKRWDGDEFAEKLELEVGRDLQFVRLNGTLVGGILGAILHFLTSLI